MRRYSKLKNLLLLSIITTFKLIAKPHYETIFLSHPRTGTNWSISCLQALTKRPIQKLIEHDEQQSTYKNRLGLDLETTKSPIHRSHALLSKGFIETHQPKILMILRNYREVLLRYIHTNYHNLSKSKLTKTKLSRITKYELDSYLKRLIQFHKIDPERRHLYKYEDLIEHPKVTLTQILQFLDEPLEPLDTFMENYESHRLACLTSYHNQWKRQGNGSNTKGTNTQFYTDLAPKTYIKIIDELVKKAAPPHIWESYLKQYCTEAPQ